MPSVIRFPKQIVVDSAGRPYAGALAAFYAPGTTTPQDTYTTSALNVANSNPVVADAAGVFPEIWRNSGTSYKLKLTQSDGTLIYQSDPIDDELTQNNLGQLLYPITQDETVAGLTPIYFQYLPGDMRRYAFTQGVSDDTALLQKWINYIVATHSLGVLQPWDFKISSTISITSVSSVSNFEIVSESGLGAKAAGGAYGPRFLWAAAGGTVFLLNNVRDAKLILGVITPAAANAIDVGLDIDGANSTNLTIGVVVSQATIGTRIANGSTSGNDLHIFEGCYWAGCTIGVSIINGQSKWHTFNECTFAQCTTGIVQTDGSFVLYSPNFSQNTIDIELDQSTDVISIFAPQSEQAGRFLYVPNQRSASQAVNVYGGRLSPSALNADGNYIVFNHGGPLNLYGSDFAAGQYTSNWRIAADNNSMTVNNGVVNVIGCVFPNTTIWNSTTVPNTPYIQLGCRGLNSDSTQSPIPNIITASTNNTNVGLIFNHKRTTVAYSASMTIDASTGDVFEITATNNTAFTFNAPTNPTDGQRISITLINTSGGALGAATWNAVFKMSTWTNPANSNNRSIDFEYIRASTIWRQVSQASLDVPN